MSTHPTGFRYENLKVLFIDPQGEDDLRSVFPIYDRRPRYRVDLYYKPGHAITAFLYTELTYEAFLAANLPKCYETYEEFCAAFSLCKQTRMAANDWRTP